jgi:hypothetical protein
MSAPARWDWSSARSTAPPRLNQQQIESPPLFVMAGLDPAIHESEYVDPRDKPGDDGWRTTEPKVIPD